MALLKDKITNWLPSKKKDRLLFSSEEFLKSLNLIIGLDQLLENFSAKLRELSKATSLYVVLYEPITNRYLGKQAKGDHPEWLSEFNLSRTDNLVKWLNVNRCPFDVVRESEAIRFLSLPEQELLRRTETVLVIPFIVVNRLRGALFLGNKLDHTPYELSEISTLSMLASQSALAIEHALMYQFQEDKLKKLFHADKLATVGELAAGAAHEIRNPLTSIRSTVQFMEKELPEERKPLVREVLEEVDRIDRIIRGLLSLSKSSELQMTTVDLEEIVKQTLFLLDSELRKHNIEVRKQNSATATTITGDPSQLKQVFLNVLLNSIQAMPNGGAIELSMAHDSDRGRVNSDKDFVSVTIKDTGPGIPGKDLQKLFDPFYTTKETGTGLGLSISYGIVSKHGGEIEIMSSTEAPNRGTTVIIRLPRVTKYHVLEEQ